MKVLFLTRSTLYTVYGGDTVQIEATAKYLRRLGVTVDISLADEKPDYSAYDLIHVFNVIRPADTLGHVMRSGRPYVLSTIFVDFSEYERMQRTGLARMVTSLLSPDQTEYLKVVLRRLRNGEPIMTPRYLRMGHKKAVSSLAGGAELLLPNSRSELERFRKSYGLTGQYRIVYNGIDEECFPDSEGQPAIRNEKLVVCVARIEGKKNQLNLIKALSNTDYELVLIGSPAPNHITYYETCRRAAGPNVRFEGFIPQEKLHVYYRQARVHVLASWNETCGLSSLEAAWYGCNIVITDKGDTREYYGDNAWYCDPGDPASIRKAIDEAAAAPAGEELKRAIRNRYNWKKAAEETLRAYETITGKKTDHAD